MSAFKESPLILELPPSEETPLFLDHFSTFLLNNPPLFLDLSSTFLPPDTPLPLDTPSNFLKDLSSDDDF